MTFGEYLKQLREAKGIGLRELSRVSKLSRSHIHYLETDQRHPGDETLKKLAPALGVSAKELIAERDKQKPATDLTLLLRETGPLTDEQREELRAIANDMLAEDQASRPRGGA